jgi:hypothetical protein
MNRSFSSLIPCCSRPLSFFIFMLALGAGIPSLRGQTQGLRLSPATLQFPVTVIGKTSIPMNVTLTSSGNSPVNFDSFTITGSDAQDFAISANSCSAALRATYTCTVSIIFTPSATGLRSATLSILDSAPGSPQRVPLSGASLSVVLSFNPAMVEFPVVTVGSGSSPALVTAANTGIASTSITSVALRGANPGDFSIASNTCSGVLTGGASCTVGVAFEPTANGIRTATLLLAIPPPASPNRCS